MLIVKVLTAEDRFLPLKNLALQKETEDEWTSFVV